MECKLFHCNENTNWSTSEHILDAIYLCVKFNLLTYTILPTNYGFKFRNK